MKRKTTTLFFGVLMTVAAMTAGANQPGYVSSTDANLNGSAVVYDYNEMNQYNVRARIGYITDVTLKPGETLQEIVAGDTERWMVSSANVAGVYHVYIKPLAKDITTNIIILSNSRSYRLIVTSSDVYDDIVIFDNVPASAMEKAAVEAAAAQARIENAKEKIRQYRQSQDTVNTRYEYKKIKNVAKSMLPTTVYNTKTKTYISIPPDNNQELPVVYRQNLNDKLSLVNYRIRDGFMVIDAVMARIYLAYGENSYAVLENIPVKETEKIGKKEANHLLNQSSFLKREQKEPPVMTESAATTVTNETNAAENSESDFLPLSETEETAVTITPISESFVNETVVVRPAATTEPAKKKEESTSIKQSVMPQPVSLKERLEQLQAKRGER